MSKTTKMIAALGIVAGLGVAAMPFGAFALDPVDRDTTDDTTADTDYHNDSSNVVFSATVTPAIAIKLDANTKEIESIAPNAANETITTGITVSTNDEAGYTLSAKDLNGAKGLVKAATGTASEKTIAGNPAVAAGTSAFAYKVTASARGASSETSGVISVASGVDNTYKAFTTEDFQIASADKRAADDTYTITYGVSTAKDQAQGTYTDTITYTAATVTQ